MRVLLALLLSCSGAGTPPSGDGSLARPFVYREMCDASGAIAAGSAFLVADDEDNRIRLYDRRGGAPRRTTDVTSRLSLGRGSPEVDLEAATVVGERAFWLTSHGRSSKGKLRPNRLRFFSTTRPAADGHTEIVGRAYDRLLEAMLADPRLARFGLDRAAELAPKAPGGLNIEGLAGTPSGGLFIGFRNPVPEGRALVGVLDNPAEVAEGGTPRFGDPFLLDLGGRGIRDMAAEGDGYLLVGGPPADGESVLYRWTPGAAPERLPLRLRGLNPEALVVYSSEGRLLVLSDDGTRPVDGVECKALENAQEKSFRGVLVDLPVTATSPTPSAESS